jgi:hypothetical protein
MTPKQVVTIDVKELKEVELRCECGASFHLPLPLKNQLPLEQNCLACRRVLWSHDSPTRTRLSNLLDALSEQKIMSLSFVVDGVFGQTTDLLGKS